MGFRARKRRAEERTTRTGGAPLRFPRAPPSSLPEAQLRLSMGSLRRGGRRVCRVLASSANARRCHDEDRRKSDGSPFGRVGPAQGPTSCAQLLLPLRLRRRWRRTNHAQCAASGRNLRRGRVERDAKPCSVRNSVVHGTPPTASRSRSTHASLGEGCAAADVCCVTGDRRDTRSRVGVDQMFFPPRAVEGEKISKALGGGEGVTPVTCHRGGYRWRTCDR